MLNNFNSCVILFCQLVCSFFYFELLLILNGLEPTRIISCIIYIIMCKALYIHLVTYIYTKLDLLYIVEPYLDLILDSDGPDICLASYKNLPIETEK